MSFDLTGLFISDTYGRLVQQVSGALYDGLGNTVTVNASTGSLATTGSNNFTGTQTISGSLELTGSLFMPLLTTYSLTYVDQNQKLSSLPTPLSPLTSSGDVIAMFVSSSNTWIMTDTIDGGDF
jgi:hypothetical protein